MALNLNLGGGDNEYVDSASRAAASGGGIPLIGSILGMLGIGTPVGAIQSGEAKAEKKNATEAAGGKSKNGKSAADAPQGPPMGSAIAEAETALGLGRPPVPAAISPTSSWGGATLDMLNSHFINPMGDPNQHMFGAIPVARIKK